MELITKRLDKITKIPPECMTDTPPVPRSVKIELTGRCNYHCVHCALVARNGRPEDMDFTLFEEITADMRSIGVEEIGVFFIGESFMNPERLIKSVEYLKRDLEFPYVFLTSNASLAYPYWVEECMEAGLDSLKWSFNAANIDQFQSITGAPASSFARSIINIQSAWQVRKDKGFKTRLYASSIRYDGEQHAKMEESLQKNVLPYVDEHYWLPLYSMGSIATLRESQLGYRPIAGNQGRFDNPVEPLPCWSLFTAGHILSDGRMTGCCFDATSNWVMGDLKNQTFMEAWHSDEFRALRVAHLAKDVTGTKCEKCIAYQ